MSHLAIVSIVMGAVLIAIRGPLLIAPEATTELYRQLAATDTRIRVAGILGILLGLWMVLSVSESLGLGAWVFWIWGWFLVVACVLLLLIFVSAYRSFVEATVAWFERSRLLRPLGAFAVVLGVLLIGLGGAVF